MKSKVICRDVYSKCSLLRKLMRVSTNLKTWISIQIWKQKEDNPLRQELRAVSSQLKFLSVYLDKDSGSIFPKLDEFLLMFFNGILVA